MLQKNKYIQYIGVPFSSGANRRGTELAPKWFFGQMQLGDSAINLMPCRCANVSTVDSEYRGVKNYEDVLQVIKELKEKVTTTLEMGKKVVIVGGDHSIAMGSITSILQKKHNVGVIWFDAHTDINTESSSPSGCAHGMPLASLLGLCVSEINNNGIRLNPASIFWVGARDVDNGEWEIIHSLGIEDHIYTSDMVNQLGMKAVMKDIRNKLHKLGVECLHVSFDIDGLDPTVVWATGTPVKKGVSDRDCDIFITELSVDMPFITSIDFVEYNPTLDDDNYTVGRWCIQTLNKLVSLL